MSMAELMVIALVALIVFGPTKLPELAKNLALFINKVKLVKSQIEMQWQQQQQQLELEDNIKKAQQADKYYK